MKKENKQLQFYQNILRHLYNEEYERILLGLSILNPTDIEMLIPDLFYSTTHQWIAFALINLNKRKEPIDLVNLKKELAILNQLDGVGGISYVASLVDGLPLMEKDIYYEHLKMLWLKRKIIEGVDLMCSTIASDGMDRVLEQLQQLEQQVDARREYVHTSQMMRDGADTEVIRTNSVLDHYFTFSPGNVVVIGGRPGTGKTSLALKLAILTDFHSPLFCSIEMSSDAILDRILAIENDIEVTEIIKNNGKYKSIPIHADILLSDIPAMTTSMIALMTAAAVKEGCGVIFIDHIQLLRTQVQRGRNVQTVDYLAQISQELVRIAKKYKVVMFVCSQLNRDMNIYDGCPPRLENLRGSGAIEQDADGVILIWEKEKKDQNITTYEHKLIIAKNRNGPIGIIEDVKFEKKFCKWRI